VDWEVMLLLTFLIAPVAAAISSLWPSPATRWVARACLTLVVLAVVLVGTLWWAEASREPPERHEDEFVEYGDDSGVIIAMSAVGIALGLVNFIGWAVAHARTPTRGDRLPPPPAATGPRP
jgi:formate hydrogenlyase subunit 3/multisubunit Na+/H+ antiporter MnhD subunit